MIATEFGMHPFVAVGIIVSWVVIYLAIIIVLLLFIAEKHDAPRSFYIIAMLGGLVGPLVFLWSLWARNYRTQPDEKTGGQGLIPPPNRKGTT